MSYVDTLYGPTFVNRATGVRMPNDTGWQDRHVAALETPLKCERAIVAMLDDYRARYGSRTADDGVFGSEWIAIGHALLGLLNGETGRLDCGTLDAFIRDTLESEGVLP